MIYQFYSLSLISLMWFYCKIFIAEETTRENYQRTQTSKAWYVKIVMMEILYFFVVI